jgi:hypothetical protein
MFKAKIKIENKGDYSHIDIISDIKVLGWFKKVLIPPLYEERRSRGKLEKEIFDMIVNRKFRDKKIDEIELNQHLNFSPPFDPNVDLITPPDNEHQNETTCEIKNTKIAVGWNDYRGGDTYVSVGMCYSHDGGNTWSQNQLPADGLWYPDQGDPVLTWGNGDTLYFAFITFNRNSWTGDIGLLISYDGGITWSDSVNITNDSYFDDKPWISAYGDTVLLSYAGGAYFYLYFRKSVDGGKTFSSPVFLDAGGNGSIPKKGADAQTIYVLWGLDSPSNPQYDQGIWIRKSVDGGNSFYPAVSVADAYINDYILPWRVPLIPSMDIDRNNGNIYVVFHSTDSDREQWDVYFTRSTDGGQSFEPPVRLNQVETGHQFFPWISVDENGVVHVIWYDTRAGGYNLDIYYTYSEDFGQTFVSEIKVTDQSKPPVRDDFIGDYIAVDALNGLVAAAWCHASDDASSDDVWFAKKEDVEISENIDVKKSELLMNAFFNLKTLKGFNSLKVFDITGKYTEISDNMKTGIYFIKINKNVYKTLKIIK